MKKITLSIIFLILLTKTIASTFTSKGNQGKIIYSDITKWNGNNAPPMSGFTNNDIINISKGDSITLLGELLVDKKITLNILGELYIDSSLLSNNNFIINVSKDGVLIIGDFTKRNGSFIANNGFTVNDSGMFIINGNLKARNNADVIINGSLNITDSASFNGGTNLQLNGTLNVLKELEVINFQILTINGNIVLSGDTCITDCKSDCSSTIKDDIITCNSFNSALPVEYFNFYYLKYKNSTILYWTTIFEKNSQRFEIEYNKNILDSISWNKIGEIKSVGGEYKQEYIFSDTVSRNGVVYYRLKQIDFDGSYEYSDIIVVNHYNNKDIYGIQNPNNGSIIINTNNPDNISVILTDLHSHKISTNITRFDNYIHLDTNTSSGIYYVIVNDSGFLYTQKIFIQK